MPSLLLTRPTFYVVVRGLVLAGTLITLFTAGYLPGDGLVWALFAAGALGVTAHSLPGVPGWAMFGGLLLASAVSGVLVVVASASLAIALCGEVAFSAGMLFGVRRSGVAVAAGLLAMVVTDLSSDRIAVNAFGIAGAFVGLWLSGVTRRQFLQRAEQAELLLAETRRATEATAAAAALAERARIAREIHDIQAHSLSALSLQLEAAGALLQTPDLPREHPALAKIAGCVDRAGRLAREGLTETSRAVRALREDSVSLPELLESLVDEPAVVLRVRGVHRDLPPGAGLTLYRAVQEALTNARKHAPGAPVTIELDYGDTEVGATVTNPAPPAGAPRPLTGTGAGYGLTGVAERAELAGGTLAAGPEAGGWRMSVRIPA
ncbi:sensor histidine kinase [Amycolatopsis anabasis]|uniref:sensor histidine kinase n=1 Tax=Amycolatopsis anabasis TaxID=1840409 RepID=UPI00131CEEA6|nr:histidine kinase [Amycolatopsis anabasis]